MYKIWILSILIFSSKNGICNHILGGEIYIISHTSLGNISGDYTLGLDLYAECLKYPDSSALVALFPSSISIAVYSNTTGKLFYSNNASNLKLMEVKSVSGGKLPDCIINEGLNCYSKATYTFNIIIPYDPNGFTVVYESCCRSSNAINIFSKQGYTIIKKVVQTNTPYKGVANFADNNNTVICANTPFSLSLLTQLLNLPNIKFSYHLTPAYGSNVILENQTIVSKGEPFVPLLYDTIQNFSGYFPLGKNVTIDTLTGIISGIAPKPGDYLIHALIKEYIEGSIVTFTKEFILKVRSCHLDAAILDSIRLNCDKLVIHFANQSPNKTIAAYNWQFLRNNLVIGNTADSTPTFVFPDTGTYTIKLLVTNSTGCQDSAKQQLRLYPSLKAGFTISGNCMLQPYVFKDSSSTTFGSIQSRYWDFGDLDIASDTSAATSPSYLYASQGIKTIKLKVINTMGCVDSVQKTLSVTDKPPLLLSTHDTLICSIDTLNLRANGQGTISWSPSYNIIGPQSASTYVFPKKTTSYIATLNANGCINSDTATVKVLDNITVVAGKDLSICIGDSIQLNPISQAISYIWSPIKGLSSETAKYPYASPNSNTKYFVTASLGKCEAKDSVYVSVYPYPIVNAGNDTLICNGASFSLHGSVNSSLFFWTSTPPTLFNTLSLTPMVAPSVSTKYILTGYQQLGCIKPFSDTVLISVTENTLKPNAGNDTSVILGQPLQLNATGGINYSWSPTVGLSNPNIASPIAILDGSTESMKYIVTVKSGACSAKDDIEIRVFKTKPDIFVPSAFTPNRDGLNDYLRAIPVGIKTFISFDIYGRWGGLIFHTTDPMKSWDGTINGKDQPIGTYIFVVKGIDYLGTPFEKAGTVSIIR
jgi:gliding motility-associated-like protein